MPLHDWNKSRGWDSVHPFWLAYLVEDLQPRLPTGFKAFLGSVPAVVVAPTTGRPDVSVRRWDPPADGEVPAPTAATAVLEPDVEAPATVNLDPHLAIHIEYHGQLIAAVELVSPRNKDRASSKETYTNRYLGYLQLGVHLLLVDVLPRPAKFSFADAINDDLGLDLPPLPAPFAAAYRVGEVVPVGDDLRSLVAVWRRPLAAGQPLPTLPLPLDVHRAVMLDLEATYRRAADRAYLD